MSVQLRRWQREAFALYLSQIAENQKTSLWEATPGAGKTAAALYLIKHQLRSRKADKALIVVPTSHLRIQWARAGIKMGLQLDSSFSGGKRSLTSDFHGAVVTYQQFGNHIRLFKQLASRSVVILDEVHHAGDGLAWGKAIRAALENAPFILCLSGTAFRSDSNPIPFVKYDRDGMSTPDFTYSYARAIEEGVCRPTAIFTYGGDVSWTENARVLSVSFSDSLDPLASARRLRAALDPEAGWVQPMLHDAHEMLKAIRREQPKAGALMVCADQKHARQMAKLVAAESGEKPTVVLSDDVKASQKIKQFADSGSMWLVACNMVSEGVDIPRLRVGVYGTTIRTKMYFRQFLGRIVRREAKVPGLQVSYLYLPADPFLQQMAHEVETETRHFLGKKKESFFDQDLPERTARAERNEPSWTALQAVNHGVDALIVHGNQLSLFAPTLPTEDVRSVIDREVETRMEERLTRSEAKVQLGSEIRRLVGLLHKKTGKPHSVIHSMLNGAQRVSSQINCTEGQLRERVLLIERML